MSRLDIDQSTSGAEPATPAQAGLGSRQKRQLGLITFAALAVYLGLRLLPTGTNLNHVDFRVEGNDAIEFCDPSKPQFISVVQARSPVTVKLATAQPAMAGRAVNAVLSLHTSSGKAIAPADLLVVHERKLHLMVVDPTLTDYQHIHPESAAKDGDWSFTFIPRRSGVYRLFADFTPVATGRGLYANTDLAVEGLGAAAGESGTSSPSAAAMEAEAGMQEVRTGGFVFSLRAPTGARAGQPLDFQFAIRREAGGDVPLRPVMGAYAHLVAFDVDRTGFAHLHPVEEPTQAPHPTQPQLNFQLTIPKAGEYVIWSQVNLDGEERFVPFRIQVR